MTQPNQTEPPVLELNPEEFMSRLGSRLRVNYNRESGRHTASFAGVYEQLGNNTKMVVNGIGKTEMDACRALALRMRDLHRLGRLQVLDESATHAGPERIVMADQRLNPFGRA